MEGMFPTGPFSSETRFRQVHFTSEVRFRWAVSTPKLESNSWRHNSIFFERTSSSGACKLIPIYLIHHRKGHYCQPKLQQELPKDLPPCWNIFRATAGVTHCRPLPHLEPFARTVLNFHDFPGKILTDFQHFASKILNFQDLKNSRFYRQKSGILNILEFPTFCRQNLENSTFSLIFNILPLKSWIFNILTAKSWISNILPAKSWIFKILDFQDFAGKRLNLSTFCQFIGSALSTKTVPFNIPSFKKNVWSR